MPLALSTFLLLPHVLYPQFEISQWLLFSFFLGGCCGLGPTQIALTEQLLLWSVAWQGQAQASGYGFVMTLVRSPAGCVIPGRIQFPWAL